MAVNLSREEMESFWMPFTANTTFKADPRLLTHADGMHYTTHDDRQILDGTAGLWCCNAGHNRSKITEAVTKQLSTLDFAPTFQMGHPIGFELANRLTEISPKGLDSVFFTNSGSESVETALKIARAYWRIKGKPGKAKLVGRIKGYHGVNFGGISVGGLVMNRKHFGQTLDVDHLPHTLLEKNRFSKGLPDYGTELADNLEDLVGLHDAENIAAVIVEPISGSAGVILPPKGYLKRLRELCDKHDILLIFDEVITGYGRVGAAFAADEFDVTPDLITTAKGLTNGVIPMGAVFVRKDINEAFLAAGNGAIELFHGYTYSAHPVACAAAIATLDVYKEDDLFARAKSLHHYFEDAVHSLKGHKNVIDIRNYGLVGAVELQPREGKPGARAYEVFKKVYETGALVRQTGDIIAISPPLIIEKEQIDRIINLLGDAINAVD
ncbi:aspartate aminotransferase family protein [Umboniibacter marinipuniceus]|uniref:Beta-alanine--pyruvate transaminase n=1 Tax=Umboniibacter marinipuniceus TaxID=569599 RepID=A0A3M0AQS5_9GAMM|nr:aspartate aminotransferase family protein [Umboniibacter marinipuniceus]RMA81352.1 beta-alanine--pyruvate transaminase [Umboniibacter marinipuniceus]